MRETSRRSSGELRQVAHLPFDQPMQPLLHEQVLPGLAAQDADGVADRDQRAAHLVAQDGQKLVS